MTPTFLFALMVAGSSLLLGCPSGDYYTPPPTLQNAGGSSAVAEAIAMARGSEMLPPPPSLETLCSLRFGYTKYDEAKKLFGKPDDESMDKSKAGQSYRYQGQSTGGSDGTVTLVLMFNWSDGDVGWLTKITGIGGSSKDLIHGYVLSEASITGMRYPACWPHEEP